MYVCMCACVHAHPSFVLAAEVAETIKRDVSGDEGAEVGWRGTVVVCVCVYVCVCGGGGRLPPSFHIS